MSPRSPPTEHSRLLEDGDGVQQPQPYTHRVLNVIKAEGEPSWAHSYRHFIFGSWFNLFLVFVPLSFISHNLGWDAGLRFLFSFLAIMPLAKVRSRMRYDFSLAPWGCHGPALGQARRHPFRSVERVVWKRGRDHCGDCSSPR